MVRNEIEFPWPTRGPSRIPLRLNVDAILTSSSPLRPVVATLIDCDSTVISLNLIRRGLADRLVVISVDLRDVKRRAECRARVCGEEGASWHQSTKSGDHRLSGLKLEA